MWLKTTIKGARYKTSDSANVLKIVILPLVVRFSILHNLRILSICCRSFFRSEYFYYMKREPLIFWLYLISSQQISNHRQPLEPFSVLEYQRFLFWKCLILIPNNWKNNLIIETKSMTNEPFFKKQVVSPG